jgi:hypothetical protein
LTSQLRLPRKDVEGILKHFLDSGNQFHFTPNRDPDLAEAERIFEIWNTDAKSIFTKLIFCLSLSFTMQIALRNSA